MLLNSYEGFDYMDYSRYSMSIKDWGIVFIKSMAATVIIAYLFYDSPIVVIAFPAVFAYCAKLCRQEGVRRQKEKLNEEFMNVLKVLSSNMLAGYSVENAWQEAEKEMELMYGNDSLMLSEIQEMNRQIKMNQTFEAEHRSLFRINTVSDSNNGIQIVIACIVPLAVCRSCFHFGNNCFFLQFAGCKNIFQMF